MKNLYKTLVITLFTLTAIGTLTPDASAALDVTSTDKGLILPPLAKAEVTCISTTTLTEKLHVSGNILATGTIAPDYVFQKYYNGTSSLKEDYKMMSLKEVEAFTKVNKHLPGVPSYKEVEEKGGIVLNRASEIQLEKIEELFLHAIEQQKTIEAQKNTIETQQQAMKLQNETLEVLKLRMKKIEEDF